MTILSRDMRVWLALLLPIVVLSGFVVSKQLTRSLGTEVLLPIEGFDPRDLLAGHYLTYRVQYGIPVCIHQPTTPMPATSAQESAAHVCLTPRYFGWSHHVEPGCRLSIRGVCQLGQFVAGIERFYIPEAYAGPLDRAVRKKSGEIIVSVTDSGTPQVKDLRIEGRPWREMVTPEPIRQSPLVR